MANEGRLPRQRTHGRAFPALAAVGAFAVVFAFFPPRFVLWNGLDLRSARHHPPEVSRAIATLRQLEDPFVRINDPRAPTINWRPLFPLLGHALGLPRGVFLALPHLGCLLVLGWVARLVLREGAGRGAAFLAAALAATASWFFVSTGWPAYFDSWSMLGLLVVAFSETRIAPALACLLAPWIDERFVLALPLALAVRLAWFGDGRGTVSGECLAFLALAAPYGALRLLALASADAAGPAAPFRRLLAPPHDARQVLNGLWSGLRGLWVFVAVAVGLCLARGAVLRGVLLALTGLATAAAGVLVADDLSRSTSALLPVAMLGAFLTLRRWPSRGPWLLAAVLVFNLLAPARHIVAGTAAVPIGATARTPRPRRSGPPPARA